MDIFTALILPMVQGMTEFLPVSSSGHLFLVQKWASISPSLGLEIWLHGASLLAIIIYFWRDIMKLTQGFVSLPKHHHNPDGILTLKLLVATLATIPLALVFESYFEEIRSLQTVGITLLVTAGLIAGAEFFRNKKTQTFTWPLVIALGLVQSVAVLPGISRSGITIAFLILMGLQRQASARISFLLAIPTIGAALIFGLNDSGATSFFTPSMITGFIVGTGASLLAIRWMMKLVQKNWIWFAPYCLLLGLAILIF